MANFLLIALSLYLYVSCICCLLIYVKPANMVQWFNVLFISPWKHPADFFGAILNDWRGHGDLDG